MATIDPTTNIGKLRLRLADWRDIQWLPDSVYQQTLDDNNNNLTACTRILSQYILAILTHAVLFYVLLYYFVDNSEGFQNNDDKTCSRPTSRPAGCECVTYIQCSSGRCQGGKCQ